MEFLQLVDELKLLDIQSNESKKDLEFPFEIQFVKTGETSTISAYRNGMLASEKASFDNYLTRIRKILPRYYSAKVMLATLPDGQYQVKDWKPYEFRIGPKEWTSWEKHENVIKQIKVPLLILDGMIADIELLEKLDSSKIESVSIMKTAEAVAAYGEQAEYGALLVATKKKRKK